MDPALLNYLQSQQANQMQPQQGQQIIQPQRQGNAIPSNPFDVGIQKAIESARESLGMTQKQQDKALRSGMLAFANNMSQQPREKGFFNNFASVGKALSPAITTYDAEENAGINENNKLANQILHYQAAEEKKIADAEQRNWQRKHAESQLAEQVRSHNLMYNFKTQKEANKFGANVGENGLIESKYPAFASKVERTPYAKTLKGANHVIGQVDKVLDAYTDFSKEYPESNSLLPYGVGAITGAKKSFFSNFSNDKTLQQEVKDRARINTLVGAFTKQFEKDLKGGILTENMLRRFQEEGIVPTKNDSLAEIQAKLTAMKEIAEEEALVSTYSLQKNAHVNINDLKSEMAFAGQARGEDMPMQDTPNQGPMLMQDANGEQYMIPFEEIEGAMNDGLELVGE